MAFSMTRLTLFAIISSVEDDLRELAKKQYSNQLTIEQFFPSDIFEKCYYRYIREYQLDIDKPNFDALIIFSDLGDILQAINTHSKLLPKNLNEYLSNVSSSLNKLLPIRNRIMHSRPLNYDDLPTTFDITEKLLATKNPIWENLQETIIRFEEEPSFVLNLSIPSYFNDSARDSFNLPIPDFDETGFIGRDQQVKDLMKYCLGPYPVTTIVGEGGVGKTAIALRVAYNILDLDNPPFDAIIWTSSKTTQLTPNEIVKIEGAITTSLGILENAATVISGIHSADPIQEILDYMTEYKILLIIDNLETVLDERIKSFLGQLPQGSKVLITSRIGLGAYEIPVQLFPLQTSESIQIIRSLAKMRQVAKLVQMPNKDLEKYCIRLKNNPGYIKWFVSAVQAGKRPEEILANPEMFLEFCLSNVYEYLSEDSRKILKAIICLPRPHSQTELAFLTEIPVVQLQKAIQQLLTTNMVTMNMIPTGSSFESTYSIAELAKEYITKLHAITADEFKYFKYRYKGLVSAAEQTSGEEKLNPYSLFNIRRASSTELVIGKYLRDAMVASKQRDIKAAYEHLEHAQILAPSFYEVYRVRAQVKYFNNDYLGARQDYETAIELEPNSPQLKYWYAQFLLRAFEDLEGSLKYLNEALALDPDAYDLHSEIARVYLYQQEYDKTAEVIDKQLERKDIPVWGLKKINDLNLQLYKRKAEHHITHNDCCSALINYEQFKLAFEKCPKELVDVKMYNKIQSIKTGLETCRNSFEHENKTSFIIRLTALEKWVENIFGADPTQEDPRIRGTVTKICEDRFGFLETDGGESIFFNKGAFRNSKHWKDLHVGSRLLFIIGMSEKGKCARLIVALD